MTNNSKSSRLAAALCFSLVLAISPVVHAQAVEEKPSALAMTADLVLVRPALLAVTAVGTAVYLVSLPFSLIGGNAKEAGNTLVVQPAEATFVRCLGCTRTGVKPQISVND